MMPLLSLLTSIPSPSPTPVLGALDSFWILVAIAVGSAVFDWLKKRAQKEEGETRPDQFEKPRPPRPRPPAPRTPPTGPSPQPAKTVDWEEELRRLLEGERPEATPPPVVVQQPEPELPPIAVPAPSPAAGRVPATLSEDTEEGPDVQLATLTESAGAYQKASQLHEAVADRLKQIGDLTTLHPASAISPGRAVSPEISQTVALLRSPRTARQAIIASFILGPPKALEN